MRFLIDVAQRKLLKPGGSIFLTNIATGNPYRPWMEYLADWFLMERSEEEILQICHSLGLQDEMIDVQRDDTGLTLMVELTKPCEAERNYWPPYSSPLDQETFVFVLSKPISDWFLLGPKLPSGYFPLNHHSKASSSHLL